MITNERQEKAHTTLYAKNVLDLCYLNSFDSATDKILKFYSVVILTTLMSHSRRVIKDNLRKIQPKIYADELS